MNEQIDKNGHLVDKSGNLMPDPKCTDRWCARHFDKFVRKEDSHVNFMPTKHEGKCCKQCEEWLDGVPECKDSSCSCHTAVDGAGMRKIREDNLLKHFDNFCKCIEYGLILQHEWEDETPDRMVCVNCRVRVIGLPSNGHVNEFCKVENILKFRLSRLHSQILGEVEKERKEVIWKGEGFPSSTVLERGGFNDGLDTAKSIINHAFKDL